MRHSLRAPRVRLAAVAAAALTLAAGDAADAGPPFGVQVIVGKKSLKEGTSFPLRVTVTNGGAAALTDVRLDKIGATGSGWATAVIVPKPASATIPPGGSKRFTATCRALLAGDVSMTSTFTIGSLPLSFGASATVAVLPKTTRASGASASDGRAWLKSGRLAATLRFIDPDTGSVIPGLSVAIARDRKSRGRAVVAVIDPYRRYPLQFVVLMGAAPRKSPRSAKSSAAPPPPLVVPVRQGVGSVLSAPIELLETGLLPPFIETAANSGRLPDVVVAAMKQLTTGDVWLPPPFTGSLPTVSKKETVASADLRGYLLTKMETDTTSAAYGFVVSGLFEPLTAAGALDSVVQDMTIPALNAAAAMAFTSVGYPSVNVLEAKWGGRVFEMIVPSPSGPAPSPAATAPLTVSARDAGGSPIPGATAELLRKDVLGMGLGRTVTDGPISLPPGTYDVLVRAPGREPKTRTVTLGPGGSSLDLVLAPRRIASGATLASRQTLYAPKGTPIQFSPRMRDALGNDVAADGSLVYVVQNAGGGPAVTLDPATGLATVLGGLGAANVCAWCDGVAADPVLVAGNWDGKLPPKPPPPPHTTLQLTVLSATATFVPQSEFIESKYHVVVTGAVSGNVGAHLRFNAGSGGSAGLLNEGIIQGDWTYVPQGGGSSELPHLARLATDPATGNWSYAVDAWADDAHAPPDWRQFTLYLSLWSGVSGGAVIERNVVVQL